MKSTLTETMHEITGSEINHYNECLDLFKGIPESQPCNLCKATTRTTCMRIRSARKNHKPELVAA